MRLGGGLGGDSRAPKEPRKKLLADAVAKGLAPPQDESRPIIRYSIMGFRVLGGMVSSLVSRLLHLHNQSGTLVADAADWVTCTCLFQRGWSTEQLPGTLGTLHNNFK